MIATTQSNLESAPADEDLRLLEGLLNDDPAAWREFNRRYAQLIHRSITRVVGRFRSLAGPEDVREIQATFCVQLLANDKRKLRRYRPERGTRLSSWIRLLAAHAAYDFLRSRRREPVVDAAQNEADLLSSASESPFDAYVVRERAGIVAALLESFSERDRRFIQLYYGEGMEPERIAHQMNISVKTVYTKKHKIHGRLEALLEKRRLAA